jgi:hypothetical protein
MESALWRFIRLRIDFVRGAKQNRSDSEDEQKLKK